MIEFGVAINDVFKWKKLTDHNVDLTFSNILPCFSLNDFSRKTLMNVQLNAEGLNPSNLFLQARPCDDKLKIDSHFQDTEVNSRFKKFEEEINHHVIYSDVEIETLVIAFRKDNDILFSKTYRF